jgi:opacity protein-like surface antigen
MSRVPSSAARFVLTSLAMLGVIGAGVVFAGTDVGSVNFTLGSKSMTSDWYLSAPKTDAGGDTLAPGSSQPALGVELTWGRQGWPMLVALDVLHSYDDGVQHYPANPLLDIPPANVRRRARTVEIGLGARRAWNVKGLSPYLGAGGSWVRANVIYEMSDPSQGQFGAPGPSIGGHDSAVGFWVGGGLYRRLGPRFQLGLSGRYSRLIALWPLPPRKATLSIPGRTVVGEVGPSVGEPGHYRFVPGQGTEVEAGGNHIGLVVGWSFPNRK